MGERKRLWQRGVLRPTYAILFGCAALIGAVWAVTLERIDHEREETVEHAVRQNDNLALAYEQHTVRTLQAVDQAVRFVRYEFLDEGAGLQLDKVFAESWLSSPLFLYAGILDRNGRVIKTSRLRHQPFDASDRPFFRHHQEQALDELRISPPTTSRVDGRPSLHATRRISAPDGSFRGVALVAIDPERLADFQQRIDLGASGVTQLVGLDGIARVRRHGGVTTFGDDMGGSQILALARRAESGNFTTRGRQDGVARFQSYRRLEGYPLVVGLGTAVDESLAGFHQYARSLYAAAAGGTLVLLFLGGGLALAYERQRRTEAEKSRLGAAYRATFDQAAVGITHSRLDGRFIKVNSRFCEMLGFSEEELLQRSFVDITHPEDREASRAARDALLSGEVTIQRLQNRKLRKDGSVIWVAITVSVVRGAEGRPEYLLSVLQDVTRQRQAQAALSDSEGRFRSLTELSSDFYWETDAEHRLVQRGSGGKRSAVQIFERGGQLGKRRWEIPYLSPDEAGWRAHRALLDARQPFRGFEISRPGDDGERFISLSGDPVFDAKGAFTGYRGVGTDITERKRAEKAALDAARRAAAHANVVGMVAASEALAAGDIEQLARLVTELAAGATGVARANVWLFNEDETELHCVDLYETESRRHSAGSRLRESEFANEFRSLKAGGRYVNADQPLTDPRTAGYVESYLKPLGITSMLDAAIQLSGRHCGLLCLEHVGPAHRWSEDEIAFACQLADKFALAITNRERKQAEARYRATFEQSGVGITHASLEGRFLKANRKFCSMLGYSEAELLARSFAEVTHPEDRRETLDAVARLCASADGTFVPEYEKRYLRKGGGTLWGAVSISLVRDAQGLPEYLIAMVKDVSARREAEAKLVHQAHYDALTELPNRTLFYDRLAQTLNQARRHDWNVGVLFLDVDRFKTVNDTLGHGIGDRLLQEVAKRLAVCVRGGDTVARIGGDEFAVIAADLANPQDASLVAAKMTEALAMPFMVDGHELFVSGSVGIATYPLDGQDGVALMKNADAAMSRAKELGRNNYQFYAAAMNERALEKLLLQNDLRRALERDEFRLHFQPKASLAGGAIVGFEALLRWQRPGHGLVPPGKFIPLLEESGLIVPVGDWVIGAACAQIRDWQRAGIEPLPIAVNLAAKQFVNRDIVAVVESALREYGVAARLLEIEITESDAMQSAEHSMEMLRRLKALGVASAIDDFGTGYSSLSYLKRFPVATLKLDRSFVKGLPQDGDDVSITLAVITMAHSLGLEVVAEGVETVEQRDFLGAHGCDVMQGYLLSPPVPAEQCAKYLAAPKRAVAA